MHTRRGAELAGALSVALVVLAGCGGSPSTTTTAKTTTGAASAAGGSSTPGAAGGVGADHECVVGGSGAAPEVAWSQLRNPILSEPTAGVKDQALVWVDGEWHMLFSYVTNDVPTPGAEHWDIASATSPDLEHWSTPSPWPAQPGAVGVASPDIVRSPSGMFVATYDSNPGGTDGSQSKLFYRTSSDLETWSAPRPLALSLHPAPADRMIDPALAWTGHGLILGYKYGITTSTESPGTASPGTASTATAAPPSTAASTAASDASGTSGTQHFEVAWSPSGSLDGPWHYIGRPDIVVNGDTIENYEFVAVAGRWRLVATSNTFDQPWMFDLVGNPADTRSWLHWTHGRMLVVPGQSWDSGPGLSSVGYEHANSVFLCDARDQTAAQAGTAAKTGTVAKTGTAAKTGAGYYYLTYSGSDELTRFGGWGHAEIGVVRSTDLVHWSLPG